MTRLCHLPLIPSLAVFEIININFAFFFNIPSNLFFAAVISPPVATAEEEASLALKLNRSSADVVRACALLCTNLLGAKAHTVAMVDMTINTIITFIICLSFLLHQIYYQDIVLIEKRREKMTRGILPDTSIKSLLYLESTEEEGDI